MKRIAAVAILLLTFATPSYAFYTQCTVIKDTDGVTRPRGTISMPRWSPLERGSKVAVMDTYRDWDFVLHFIEDHEEYKWVKGSILTDCHAEDGTP